VRFHDVPPPFAPFKTFILWLYLFPGFLAPPFPFYSISTNFGLGLPLRARCAFSRFWEYRQTLLVSSSKFQRFFCLICNQIRTPPPSTKQPSLTPISLFSHCIPLSSSIPFFFTILQFFSRPFSLPSLYPHVTDYPKFAQRVVSSFFFSLGSLPPSPQDFVLVYFIRTDFPFDRRIGMAFCAMTPLAFFTRLLFRCFSPVTHMSILLLS